MHTTTHPKKPAGWEYSFHYTRFPALRAYIDRVGAEPVNHRRFLVKEYRDPDQRRGYYTVKATIKIAAEEEGGWTVECRDDEFKPKDDELEAIEVELVKVDWPHSELASWAQVEELLKSGLITGTPYVFPSFDRKSVIMVQECIIDAKVKDYDKKDPTKKSYKTWALFMADGHSQRWLDMEPDGDSLPFWKPPKYRERVKVMIHEGAKAAKFCDDLINSSEPEWVERRKTHPWFEELKSYEHWGASGGAAAIDRSDMEELRRLVRLIEGTRVVYSCDNDKPGRKAVRAFSTAWGERLVMQDWDDRFMAGWDLADPVPEKVSNLPMRTFAQPATWATKLITVTNEETGEKKRSYVLTDAFKEDWVHVVTPEVYISVDFPQKSYTQRGIDHRCANFCDGRVKVSSMLHKDGDGLFATIDYYPCHDGKRRCTNSKGEKAFNTYYAREWRSYDKAPDIGPWLDFMAKVFPNESERAVLTAWAATLVIAGTKMAYGLLLISDETGMGKTTFADILATLLGTWNVSYPNENQIVGDYNEWAEKRLAICPEIYQGHSSKAVNKLKNVVTDKTNSINRKYIEPYTTTNSCEFIACSNSLRALKLDNTDRRWFVPEVTKVKYGLRYWTAFNKWLNEDDGYRKIASHLRKYLETHEPVAPGTEAPLTKAKKRVMESFRSEGTTHLIRPFQLMQKAQMDDIEVGDRVVLDGEVISTVEAKRVVLMRHAGIELVTRDDHAKMAVKNKFPGRESFEQNAVRDAVREAKLYKSERLKTVWGRDARIITASQLLAELTVEDLAVALANGRQEAVRLADGSEVRATPIRLKDDEMILVAVVELERLADELAAF
jgi:hypothetical protein